MKTLQIEARQLTVPPLQAPPASSAPAPEAHAGRLGGAQVFAVSQALGRQRLRAALIERFPAAGAMPSAELDAGLDTLLESAAAYGLEKLGHLQSYVFTGWRLGLDFDRRFPAYTHVLSNLQRPAALRIAEMDALTAALFAALESGAHAGG